MVTLASTVIDRVLKGFRQLDQPDVLNVAIATTTEKTLTFLGILSGWGESTVAEIGSELFLVTEQNGPRHGGSELDSPPCFRLSEAVQ